MKKLLILAAAVAAMAACTKSQTVYDRTDEIGMVPVNYSTTKVTHYGPVEGTEYPVNENFGVFAQYTTAVSGTGLFSDDSALQPYLKNAQFSRNGDNNGIWHGYPSAYYWPKTGSLYFAGYSPYGIAGTVSYDFSNNGKQNLNIDGFVQNNYSYSDGVNASGNEMIDLMWFDALNSQNGGTYPATFKHALSYLTFRFNADVDELYTIKKVWLSTVNMAGDFDSKNGFPTWTGLNDGREIVLYNTDAPIHNGDDRWFVIDDVLLLPQATVEINIQYTMKGSENTAIEIPVYSYRLTGGDTSGDTSMQGYWMAGKHYTYTISFTSSEITVKPDVQLWVPVTFGNQI